MKSSSALRTISDPECLRDAWRQISKRNLRSRGLDNVTIAAFKSRLSENLLQISKELRDNTYKFTPLRAHSIKKQGSAKPRPIQIASVRDRVVIKSLAAFIEPSFRKFDLDCSFAFIKGRGVGAAIKRIQHLVSEGNNYYFEADILNFFGAVDKRKLWIMFCREIRHKSLLPLLEKCFYMELENLESHKTEFQYLFFGLDLGIPQGGVLSPMLANFYLYEFDRKMLTNGFNLVRYADDFVVMCKSLEQAHEAHQLARTTLKALNLDIHPLEAPDSKSRIDNFSKHGLTFLGIRFEGRDTFPTSKAVKRFEAKVAEILKPNTGNSLFKTLQKLTNLITGWGKWYRTMKVSSTYLRLDDFIKDSIKDYLLRSGIQLTGKDRRKHMRLLGIPSLAGMIEHSGKTPVGLPPS